MPPGATLDEDVRATVRDWINAGWRFPFHDDLFGDFGRIATRLAIPTAVAVALVSMRVAMRARVLDRSKTSDPGFQIQVQLDRDRFLAGEDVSLSVRASRDSRIYVLGITEGGAAVLLPNKWFPDTRADAGEWLRFPGR